MFDWMESLWSIWPTSILLIVFTVLFILADEWIAKPWRHRKLMARKDHDPLVKRALETAEMVERLKKERGHD